MISSRPLSPMELCSLDHASCSLKICDCSCHGTQATRIHLTSSGRLSEDQRLHAAAIVETWVNDLVLTMGGDLKDVVEVLKICADQEELDEREFITDRKVSET